MSNRNRNAVSLKVDKTYFDNIFEVERKNLSQRVGRNFTQREFTAYLAHSGAKIVYPNKIKNVNTFAPKKSRERFGYRVGI